MLWQTNHSKFEFVEELYSCTTRYEHNIAHKADGEHKRIKVQRVNATKEMKTKKKKDEKRKKWCESDMEWKANKRKLDVCCIRSHLCCRYYIDYYVLYAVRVIFFFFSFFSVLAKALARLFSFVPKMRSRRQPHRMNY